MGRRGKRRGFNKRVKRFIRKLLSLRKRLGRRRIRIRRRKSRRY
jgi:hypothetical protein